MNTAEFLRWFERAFPLARRNRPAWWYEYRLARRWADPCPAVQGMTAPRNQRLLGLAVAGLSPSEAYLEIGTFQGKTLVSALVGNPVCPAYACDNFSEFAGVASLPLLEGNLARYGLSDRVTFLNADFRTVLTRRVIGHPVGVYLYDGAHDEGSQYDGIALAEPILADEALVIVDDWRHAPDSGSYAEAGTRRAIADSHAQWEILFELPARRNGDLAMWWNGVGVLRFRRLRKS